MRALTTLGVGLTALAASAVALAQATWGGAPAGAGAGSTAPTAQPPTSPSTWGGGPSTPDAGVSEAPSTWGGGAAIVQAPPPSNESPVAHPPAKKLAPVAVAADAGTDDGGAPTSSGPPDVGFSVGIRGGYSLPFGTANSGPLDSVVSGSAPIQVDVGWFLSRKLYIGGYFQYGFGINAGTNNDTCSDSDTSCTATLYRVGVVSHWHFRPETAFDPWVGGGLGYEALAVQAQSEDDGSTVEAATLQGFILSGEAGLDFKPLSYVGIGPYVELAAGQYILVESFSPHLWGTLGLRLRTNL